jgi:hypothetical protein
MMYLINRWLAYDESTGFTVVVDEGAGLLVDLSLCDGPRTGAWIRERMSIITAIGYIEPSNVGSINLSYGKRVYHIPQLRRRHIACPRFRLMLRRQR